MAEIYSKSGEHLILCAVREAHVRQFQATDWTDLRVGFFLSITKADDEDDPSGLAETIGTEPRPSLPWTDRAFIGLTDRQTGTVLLGYTNLSGNRLQTIGSSRLVSSDVGIGTTDATFWRTESDVTNGHRLQWRILDGGVSRAVSSDGSQVHFIQDPVEASGYCTFLGMRFTRPNAHSRSRIISMSVKKTVGGHSGDILFTDDPSNDIGIAQLQSFPTDVQTLGPVELSHVPDTFYFYWPFHDSRLRIHEICLVKAA